MTSYDKEQDIILYLKDLSKEGFSFVIFRDQVKHGKNPIIFWGKIKEQLKDIIKKKELSFQDSDTNVIILLKEEKPLALIKLKKIIRQSGSPKYMGILINTK